MINVEHLVQIFEDNHTGANVVRRQTTVPCY